MRFAAALLLCLFLLPAAVRAAEDAVVARISQGLNGENASWRECPLGDYVADAVRAGTGTQIALIPAALLQGDLVGDGEVTEAELSALLTADADVYIYTLTASQLKALLEEGVSRWQLGEKETLDGEISAYEGFLQISGLAFKADASAAPGERILSVTLAGEPLELTDGVEITAAIPEKLTGMSGKREDRTMLALLREYMTSQGTVELTERDRIQVIGAHERDIISWIPVWAVVVIVLIIGANAVLTKTRKEETERRPW